MNIEVERVRDPSDRRRTQYWRVVDGLHAIGAVRLVEQGWRVTMYPSAAASYRLPAYEHTRNEGIAAVVVRHSAVLAGERHYCCHADNPGPHTVHCSRAFRLGLEVDGDPA